MMKPNENNKTKESIKINDYIKMLDEESKFKFWIKTLLSSYSTLPEIIKTIDKIIELQATSITFSSDVYNKSKSAIAQVEKVIDLTERKNSVLNIYVMIKEMLKKLSEDEAEILEKKFVYNWSMDDLAREYEISTRTVYRKIDRLINQIYEYCKKHNWTLRFIETQTKDEGWLKEKYLKIITEYYKSTNYKILQ